jgi:HSP20 family molecular chaperone IbpA
MHYKFLLTTAIASSLMLSANSYVPHLSSELKRNERIILEYEKAIEQLKERNKFLVEAKKKNPKMYEEKALFEETKNAYIQRVKLDGAEANNIDFKVENHMLSLQMSIKITRDDKDGYYQSSRSFYQEYSIPKDVEESKISHAQEGDYFVITMPKKK